MKLMIWDVDGGKNQAVEVEAKMVLGGIFDKYSKSVEGSFFGIYYNDDEKYVVVENTSGCSVGKGITKQEALARARDILNSVSIQCFSESAKHTSMLFKKITNKQIYEKKIKTEKKLPRRALVFEKNNGKCFYCNDSLVIDGNWHIEHKHPKSKGGSNDISNLVPSCPICNLTKKDKTAKEFLEANLNGAR